MGQERSDLTDDAALFRQLVAVNVPGAPIASVGLLGLYLAYPDTVLLALAIVVGFTLVVQRFAVYYAQHGRIREGVNALALGIWIPVTAMALLTPALWPLVCVFSVLSVVLALPFVDSGHLLRLTLVASAILVVGAIALMFDPLLPFEETPERLVTASAGVGAMVGGILCLFSIRQSNARLRDTLTASRQANDALRESEHSLERKVDERTTELGEARDAALEANRAKSNFLANMSHELRTPLNAIIGYGEMLQEEVTDNAHDDYRPDLDRIVTSGRQLLGLINDVLDLAKIEAGKLETYMEKFVVAELFVDIESTIRPLAARRDNSLEFHCEPEVGAMRSDVAKVRQGLLNILSNAAKFTEHGVITLTARREPERSNEVLFRAVDTGIGMTPDQISKVFESFQQAEETTARDYGGTGLGLAITKQFFEVLGGSVHCESQPGVGTTFEVRVPDESTELAAPLDPVEGRGLVGSDAAGPSVLVVDDDAAIRDLLSRFLTREGFSVATEATGAAALEHARRVAPDVITLDVIMPGMDGWDVLRELKADPELEHIPVILMTITNDRRLGYALGAAEYLSKPVDWDRLRSALNRLHLGSKGTVLVVDDDPAARDIVGRGLTRSGWHVVEAEHGRRALERLEHEIPALIVLDLMMPEMDGFEFVAALRERIEWRDIPVIVLTSMDVNAADRERLVGGVGQILAKADDALPHLLGEVQRAMRAKRDGGTNDGTNTPR